MEERKKSAMDDAEVQDILKDLDRLQGTRGKEWSIEQAKKLGLTAEEIETYFGGK